MCKNSEKILQVIVGLGVGTVHSASSNGRRRRGAAAVMVCSLCGHFAQDSWSQIAWNTWKQYSAHKCPKCSGSKCEAYCHHASHGETPVARELCGRQTLHRSEQIVYLNRKITAKLPDFTEMESLPRWNRMSLEPFPQRFNCWNLITSDGIGCLLNHFRSDSTVGIS